MTERGLIFGCICIALVLALNALTPAIKHTYHTIDCAISKATICVYDDGEE